MDVESSFVLLEAMGSTEGFDTMFSKSDDGMAYRDTLDELCEPRKVLSCVKSTVSEHLTSRIGGWVEQVEQLAKQLLSSGQDIRTP